MNPYWEPPDIPQDGDGEGSDVWFDLWVREDGSLGSYLGLHDDPASLPSAKVPMQAALEELASGRTESRLAGQDPLTGIDLTQGAVLVRVVHQRNGATSCGWGRFGAELRVLRPLGELVAAASERLAPHRQGFSC